MFKKLYTPRAPKRAVIPEGVQFRIHMPDTRSQVPVSGPVLSAAVKRVAEEIASLRATIGSAARCRPASVLEAEIAGVRSLLASQGEAVRRLQAQGRAGLIKEAEIIPSIAAWDQTRSKFHKLHAELQQRTAADEAAAQLNSLLEEVQ